MLKVMGVDPGLQSTGYGIIEDNPDRRSVLEGGVISTRSTEPLPTRLSGIYREISAVMSSFCPDVVVVEDLFTCYSHPQTAVLMGHARGVILLASAENAIPLVVYTASLVKRALTGNGRASKVQVAKMVSNCLGLDKVPAVDHVTDALALALCHCNARGHGYEPSLNLYTLLKRQ